MKKGYHYTSKENWEKIQKDGMIRRYLIDKEELRSYFPGGVKGVWVWKDEPTGMSHAGNVMYQVGTKGSPDVVKLEIDYNPRQVATYHGHRLEILHQGRVENWKYHYQDRGLIVKNDIPIQDIKVVGSYNTVQRLQ